MNNKIWLIMFMLIAFSNFSTAVLNNNLDHAWLLENASADDSISTWDFTDTGTDSVAGINNNARLFNAGSDLLSTTNVFYNNEFSLSMWIKSSSGTDCTSSAHANGGFFTTDDNSGTNGFHIGCDNTANKYLFYSRTVGINRLGTATWDANWHNVIITYDNAEVDKVHIYIDNVLDMTLQDTILSGGASTMLGRKYLGLTDRSFGGAIDELYTWNRILTSTERTNLYNGGIGKFYPFDNPIDNNITISLNYPINNSIFYGDYNGIISVDLTNVNNTANCDINNTNWIINGSNYGNETVYFYNNNVTGNNQSFFINCSDLDSEDNITFWFYRENVINITFYNEQTLKIMNGTNITIDFISSTGVTNASTTTGHYSAEYFPLGDVEISFTAPGYVIRQNYFTLFPGQQYSINLYLINESIATQILFDVSNEFGDPVEGYRIKTMRRIGGIYYLIETSKTNWQGLADFYGLLSTPMYYWIIVDDYDNIYKQTGESEIYATTLPFSIVEGEPIDHIYSSHGALVYTLNFDNTTNKFTYNYIDTSYTSTEARLTVTKFPSGDLVATNYTTSQIGILTVDLSSIFENGTTYLAKATMNYSPSTYISSISHSYPLKPFVIGNIGLFLTIIIIIGIAFAGLWNPAVMFILEGLTIFLTRATGLHHFSYITCVTIFCLCLVSAYIVSDRT